MKTLSFSKDSWHYRFTNRLTDYSDYCWRNDICTYTRFFIWAVIKALFIVAACLYLGSVISLLVLFPMISIVVWFIQGLLHLNNDWINTFNNLKGVGIGDWCSILGIVILVGINLLVRRIQKWRDRRIMSRNRAQDNVLVEMYRSWMEKSCVKIDWK
jgi:hypothetical protein